jgi:nicotinamidase-related amidase
MCKGAVQMTYALLVIDVQKAIFEMKQPVFATDELISNIKSAVSIARTNGIRMIFSQHENKSFLQKGTRGYEIVDDLGIRESDIVLPKKHPDIFLDTGLDDMLKEQGVETVIIAGLISNGCVKEACLSALKKGYSVCLLSGAHSTFYKNAKNIIEETNREMEAAGVCVMTVEQFIIQCS